MALHPCPLDCLVLAYRRTRGGMSRSTLHSVARVGMLDPSRSTLARRTSVQRKRYCDSRKSDKSFFPSRQRHFELRLKPFPSQWDRVGGKTRDKPGETEAPFDSYQSECALSSHDIYARVRLRYFRQTIANWFLQPIRHPLSSALASSKGDRSGAARLKRKTWGRGRDGITDEHGG